MGITGLLPFIKNACRPANIRDFKGCTVAVDAYSWLHKGAFSCAERLVKGEKTDGYVHYCIKQLNLLLDAGLKPIMVFDGCNLESKAGTEKKRRENREKTKQRGKELLCQGNIKEARECFQRCVDVTPEMALEVIKACKAKNVDCIVAPYEADAQMAYLNKMNIAQIIITEDSDLVVFGCTKILFKMDSCGGGLLYEKENLSKVFGNCAEKMSFDKFRFMCILSGCDYLPSLPGIGLAKARKFVMVTSNPNLESVLPKLPSYLQTSRVVVTPEYVEDFRKANNTFLYQLVFCPKKKGLAPLNPYPEGLDASQLEYAGKYVPDDMAVQIAMGEINVNTMRAFHSTGSKSTEWSNNAANEGSSAFDSSIWNSGGGSPPKSTHENSFRFRQKLLRSTQSSGGPQKRSKYSSEQADEVNDVTDQDDLIFSEYCTQSSSSPNKKQKTSPANDPIFKDEDQENQTPTKPSTCLPFRKTLSSSSVNIIKEEFNIPFRKIVRSRFFSDTNKSRSKDQTSKLDSLDEEYCTAPGDKTEVPENTKDGTGKSPDKSSGIFFSVDLDFLSPDDKPASCLDANSSQECVDSSGIGSSICQSSNDEIDGSGSETESPSKDCDLLLELIESENSQVQSSADESARELLGLSINSSPCNSSVKSSPYFNTKDRPSTPDSDEPEILYSSCPEKPQVKRNIMTKCRTIGLSKGRGRPKKSPKQTPPQNTLFSFQFTKCKATGSTPA